MKKYLSESDAAKFLGLSRCAMQNLRKRGLGPPYFRLTKELIRYDIGELRAFLNRKRVDNGNYTKEKTRRESTVKKRIIEKMDGIVTDRNGSFTFYDSKAEKDYLKKVQAERSNQ